MPGGLHEWAHCVRDLRGDQLLARVRHVPRPNLRTLNRWRKNAPFLPPFDGEEATFR
jgi:hypothetical protein